VSYVQKYFLLNNIIKNSSIIKFMWFQLKFSNFITYFKNLILFNNYNLISLLNKYFYLYIVNFFIFFKKSNVYKNKLLNSLTLANLNDVNAFLIKTNKIFMFKLFNKNFIFFVIIILKNYFSSALFYIKSINNIKIYFDFLLSISNFFLNTEYKKFLIS